MGFWFELAKIVIRLLNAFLEHKAFREGWNAALAETDAATKDRLARALAARTALDVVRDDDPFRRD